MSSSSRDSAARAANRRRQAELYGAPLSDPVRRVTTALGISQARLGRVLGVSASMLSQLVSGHRVTLADPTALTRLRALDTFCRSARGVVPADQREDVLQQVKAVQWRLAS